MNGLYKYLHRDSYAKLIWLRCKRLHGRHLVSLWLVHVMGIHAIVNYYVNINVLTRIFSDAS